MDSMRNGPNGSVRLAHMARREGLQSNRVARLIDISLETLRRIVRSRLSTVVFAISGDIAASIVGVVTPVLSV